MHVTFNDAFESLGLSIPINVSHFLPLVVSVLLTGEQA